MVVVAVAGAHTREIWLRLPLEIAVAIEDRCRGWGPLELELKQFVSMLETLMISQIRYMYKVYKQSRLNYFSESAVEPRT